jgi:hypothetical protein
MEEAMMRALGLAVALGAGVALAQENPCQGGLAAVKKEMAETPMAPGKDTQVRALLEQVEKACRENNAVVAQAGLDQVKAILDEQRRQRS